MRILILNWMDIRNPAVGGAEIILFELAKRLVKDGHAVEWFCRSFSGALERDEESGIKIIRRGNRFTVYWEAYKYYLSLTNKPDKVIESINTICWQTPLYVPQKKRIAYVNQLAREVLLTELPPVISHLSYLLEPLEYKTYQQTKFICYSDSVKEDIATFGISKTNIFTFQLGIDHARYIPGKKNGDPLFIFVARLARMKRPDLCIEAMKEVVKKHPKAKMAILGYGPIQKDLESLINRYDLEKNVFLTNKNTLFFSKTPKDEKVKYMQSAWALLLPSIKEGWGMVVTEAAACGTPAIVSDVTGLRNSVIPFKTGLILSQSPTPTELSDAIVRLIEDEHLRKQLSQGAIEWSKKFNWEKSYTEFSLLLFKS